MISINQFKNGLTILINNEIFSIVDYQHVKPGKGSAFVRTRLKNIKTGLIQEKTFRGEEKVEEAFVEERKLQFLYSQREMYYFMDMENYDQLAIHKDNLEQITKFLKDNLVGNGYFHKGQILNINLPNFVDLKVIETEPGFRGNTAKGGTKPAKLETNATVNVPLFINVGDKLKIDTRSGKYIERVT